MVLLKSVVQIMVLVHWLACVLVSLATEWPHNKKWAACWAILTVFLNPLVVVSVQRHRLPIPNWGSWLIRVLVAVVVAVGLVKLGDSEIMRSRLMLELKGHLVSMFISEIVVVQGHRLDVGDEWLVQSTFCNAAFATSAIVFAFAMCLFRNPFEKALILAVCAFATTLLIDSVFLAQYLTASEEVRIATHDLRPTASSYVPIIVYFWLTVAWARFDARSAVETTGSLEGSTKVPARA